MIEGGHWVIFWKKVTIYFGEINTNTITKTLILLFQPKAKVSIFRLNKDEILFPKALHSGSFYASSV